MKVKFDIQNHCKFGGGLFLGVRLHFPSSCIDIEVEKAADMTRFNNVLLTFGFIFFSINVNFQYNFNKLL
jgi:hypothetical protein